ncbi:MAG TPA: hydrid cluster protein-associated redox disulfide domain protein [Anaerolineae bacterium]|nr:hydrid cluster protein-associated redox disulfide domain protein [Anaerolineae bacterium]
MNRTVSEEILLEELTVEEILSRWPQTARVFNHYSSSCIGCAIAPFCTISDAVTAYGLPRREFVADLQAAIEPAGDEKNNV